MGVSQVVSVPYALQASSLKEGATITGANGSQYTLTVGANGPVWSLTNPNVNFSCGQSLTFAGESYPTVQIGTQCWFQKNLNVGTVKNTVFLSDSQQNNGIIEKYCQYKHNRKWNHYRSTRNDNIPKVHFYSHRNWNWLLTQSIGGRNQIRSLQKPHRHFFYFDKCKRKLVGIS
jgi:hypothetical protein